MNISFLRNRLRFSRQGGDLMIPENDEITYRLAMLITGQCEGKVISQRSVERIIADYGLQRKTLRH